MHPKAFCHRARKHGLTVPSITRCSEFLAHGPAHFAMMVARTERNNVGRAGMQLPHLRTEKHHAFANICAHED